MKLVASFYRRALETVKFAAISLNNLSQSGQINDGLYD